MTLDAASLASDYAAALDWWREAGVDWDYADEPVSWLREPEEEAPAPAPPQRTVPRKVASPALERALAGTPGSTIAADRSRWPVTLAEFREYWITEPGLDEGALRDRVAPLGEKNAALMCLVGQPDDGDGEALLSGEQGRMLQSILRAIGLAADQTYIASALPRPTPLPDWADLAGRGLADLTRHHIELAAPRRLIVFGKGSALLTEGTATPRLVAPELGTLARSPGHKRRFWNQWLEFSRP